MSRKIRVVVGAAVITTVGHVVMSPDTQAERIDASGAQPVPVVAVGFLDIGVVAGCVVLRDKAETYALVGIDDVGPLPMPGTKMVVEGSLVSTTTMCNRGPGIDVASLREAAAMAVDQNGSGQASSARTALLPWQGSSTAASGSK